MLYELIPMMPEPRLRAARNPGVRWRLWGHLKNEGINEGPCNSRGDCKLSHKLQERNIPMAVEAV
jgi:hypothetical protein